MSILLAQHNVLLALGDHLSPIIRDLFDGDVAKGYACTCTKTTAILMLLHLHSRLNLFQLCWMVLSPF